MAKIKKLKQVNGKDESKRVPTTIDELWHGSNFSKYNTASVSEYEQSLRMLNTYDLERKASEAGIMPSENTEKMIKRLVDEFNMYQSSRGITYDTSIGGGSKVDKKIMSDPDLMKFLNRGS